MPKNELPCLIMQVGAAVVVALGVTVLVIKGAEQFYGKPEQAGRGYTVDVANTPPATPMAASASGAAAAGAPPKEVDIMPYLAKADLSLGEKIIKRCQVCHNFEKGGPNTVGPNQYGLVGRKVASVPGFDYSDGMKAHGGEWTFQALSTYLTNPAAVVPGTKMGFPGLPRPEDRAAIIAYINKTYSDKPLDISGK